MFGDGALTFREFAMREPLPLATIHDAVLDFLRGRDDAALYGAQAVNAYVDEPRMTQKVDIMSTRGKALAEEIRRLLNERFKIATRVRQPRRSDGNARPSEGDRRMARAGRPGHPTRRRRRRVQLSRLPP